MPRLPETTRWLLLAGVLAVAGCRTEDPAPAEPGTGTSGASGASAQPDGQGGTSAAPAAGGGAGSGAPADGGAGRDAPPTPERDAAQIDPGMDAGLTPADAGSDAEVPIDAGDGILGTGSCCAEHDTPGCSNADLQVCVCELVPACCTEAWNAPCVLIVQQKHCQAGVRECVCGDGDGQWQQSSCCELEWTDTFCDEVAETKCGAAPGCS